MDDRESDRSDVRSGQVVRTGDDEVVLPVLRITHAPCPVTLTSQQVDALLLRVQGLCRPYRSLDYRTDAFVFMTHGLLDACDARTRVMTEKALLWLARDLLLIDVHALNRALSEIDARLSSTRTRGIDRPSAEHRSGWRDTVEHPCCEAHSIANGSRDRMTSPVDADTRCDAPHMPRPHGSRSYSRRT